MWWKWNQHPWSWRQASSEALVSAGICKSQISPYILRIPGALKVTSLEDLRLMTRCSAGIAVCVLFVFPCSSLAESFLTVALWLRCAGRKMQRESLAAGGQSFPARPALQPEPHISRCCREETLFGIQPISMHLLCFQEIFPSFKQQRKKKASLCVRKSNQCH